MLPSDPSPKEIGLLGKVPKVTWLPLLISTEKILCVSQSAEIYFPL